MEPVPLIPKPKFLPNSDATSLLRELFQDEFQAVIPTKKATENLTKCFLSEEVNDEDEPLDNLVNRRDNVVEYAKNVLGAYITHDRNLKDIREAEKNIFETHADFLEREITASEDETHRDFLTLKRQPLFKALDAKYVKKYKLLQAEAGLPLEHELNSDFRVKNFEKWRKELENVNQDDLKTKCLKKSTGVRKNCRNQADIVKKTFLIHDFKKAKKDKKDRKKHKGSLKAQPKILFFTDYKMGDVYVAEITLTNTYSKGVKFQLKPLSLDGPFKVMFKKKSKSALIAGISLQLTVEFTPKSLDAVVEDLIIATEDGNRLLIPLVAYLEPPVLKTHRGIDELTNITSEIIGSSYIECGTCFTGDTKVIKLKFRCYQGSGEFFIMSSENWTRNYVNTVTSDNLLEIPPFRIYPVFFKLRKDEVIDLFVEFSPKNSGTQVENITIACDNGQVRSLDLLGDAVGWHSYYFTFQDSLLKELTVEKDDDMKSKYYLDFDHTTANGKVEKVFCVSNNSDMAFEFQWKIREANIISLEKYSKLWKYEVKIDPESGTFEPNSVWEFLVTIQFNNAEISKYRMVLSLYVLNLPYQCIEEDNTVIQPTGLVRNLYSQSLYGEEEASLVSPELASVQGTYESLQESIKSYAEYQNKAMAAPKSDFCRTVCIPNPTLCAKPLKKSKTFFNIGEGDFGCTCRTKPAAPESVSESCGSNNRDEKTAESPLRNDIIWDFVDILVDEVELWAEVVPTRVTLEPCLINLGKPLNVNDDPIFKKVTITNHNQCPVSCTWVIQTEILTKKNLSTNLNKSSSNSFFLLYDKNLENKNQNDSKNLGYQQQFNIKNNEMKKSDLNFQRMGKIFIKPGNKFKIPGLCEFICEIGISAGQPGKIKEILCLNVNEGEFKLELLIIGKAVEKSFKISPNILDFGIVRQGTRYTKEFQISSENSNRFFWKINHYIFDFENTELVSSTNTKIAGYVKNKKGLLLGNSAVETYCLDARVPGIKFSILEVQENNAEVVHPKGEYILILGDVKTPNLFLSSPRFANAILAPPGAMYVGQKISTKVTLTNIGSVETFINWGHSFGCHCRKIKLDIYPNNCRIEKQEKLTINIDITPLDQGIISHCYVPCFFCRSAEPLILSVVGIIESLNVTFEIIDYPMQTHADPRTFLKSPFYHTVLRFPWPIKTYNPTLSLKNISERDILKMNCHCLDVEDEVARAFGGQLKQSSESDLEDLNGTLQTFQNLEVPEGSLSQLSKKTVLKNSKSTGLSDLCSPDSKKSNESSVVVYSFTDNSSSYFKFKKFHLEFLCVPYRTPVLRQFVIRNETPIETSFHITVHTYGISKNLPDRRLETIKNRVFGFEDEFQNKLMKDQPLVIIVEPSTGELKSFDAVCINVQCYGNTWGEYRDHLNCQIKGIESFNLKMFIQIIGHPLHFPVFKTQASEKPVLRFQPCTFIKEPQIKQIKVINRSCIPLSVFWIIFQTKPIRKEEREDSYNLCADSNITFESHHSEEESAQSSKNYIPRNASESVQSFPCMPESNIDFCENSEIFKSKTEHSLLSSPSKKELSIEKFMLPVCSTEEAKSEIALFSARFNTGIFQVNPKEMCFEPFEEKKMEVTFNPQSYKIEIFPQVFTAVLAACVKLKPEDEICADLYFRPCGIRFASEIMDFDAVVEIPTLSYEIIKGDLKFTVDSNEVLKSKSKRVIILRKFLVKNKNQKTLTMKIEIFPGMIFRVTKVNTIDKFYPKYNSESHILSIEPGQLIEMELECLITNKDVMYAYEKLLKRRKIEKSCVAGNQNKNEIRIDNNVSQQTSSHSDNSVCSFDYKDYGEEFILLPEAAIPCKPKPFNHMVVVEEKISFVQCGLVAQSLVAQLHISFPAIRISPTYLDFGNVYLGETAVRYCSLINLTGFSTDFKIIPACNNNEFVASPLTGCLPPTDYKSDTGKTITINFKPSKPGHYRKVFNIYSNMDMVFDFYELSVSGFGTWNEKYKSIKFETC